MAQFPNTLTNLIPDIIQASDTVAREQTGLIPRVTTFSGAEGVAKGETVRIPQTGTMAAEAISAGASVPDTGAQTIGNTTMSLDQAYAVPFTWDGENQSAFRSNGSYGSLFTQQVAQAIRTLNNQIEADIAEKYVGASRAWGTAGTTPFASSLEDAAQLKKILDDNGAPADDRHLVVDTAGMVKLSSLSNLNAAYANGSDATLRSGNILPIYGFSAGQSAQIQSHTKGGMTGFQLDATIAAGVSTLTFDGGTVNSTGCKAGDIITIGSGGGTGTADSNKYVVKTGSTATSGSIVIGNPGLKLQHVDNDEITIGDSYTANLAFQRGAIVLMARPPKRPEGGDLAVDVATVTDPVTGLTYSIAMYKSYMGVRYQVELVWGVAVVKPEFLAILLG